MTGHEATWRDKDPGRLGSTAEQGGARLHLAFVNDILCDPGCVPDLFLLQFSS